MARKKVKRINDYIEETKNNMISMSTYRNEYDELIKIYATLLFDFERIRKQYEKEGMNAEVETAAGNPKKSANLSALENIRKDIITYSDRLLLNPKMYANTEPPKEDNLSKLEKIFNGREV